MQKTFIAITLALTLSLAIAYNAPIQAGYVKVPQSVSANNDSNFTNSTGISLISLNPYELDLLGANATITPPNITYASFSASFRKLDGKGLTASTNTSAVFGASLNLVGIANGVAVSSGTDNDTNNVPQVSIYQSSLTGGATINRILASSNTNNTFIPKLLSSVFIGKTVYLFILVAPNKVNVTNVAVGGAKGSLEFTFTSALNGSLSVAWGEALGSSQVFAAWMEGTALKDGVVDVSKGTVTANTVGGWGPTYACVAYSTDKKWYGDLCWNNTGVNQTLQIYARSNTTSLALLTTTNSTLSTIGSVVPYGQYLAIFYTDRVTTGGNTTYSYDIWNLDTYAAFRNRTTFLTADNEVQLFRVPSGGFYTLSADQNVVVNNQTWNFQNIQVGLVLGGSYLTSVLSFILTIVAGLLLF